MSDFGWEDFPLEVRKLELERFRDEILSALERGDNDTAMLRLVEVRPQLLEADPQFPILYEKALEKLGRFVLPADQNDGKTRWREISVDRRRKVWEGALAILEQGNYQLLWQDVLVRFPELMDVEPRLKEAWERRPDGDLPELSPWEQLWPDSQQGSVSSAVSKVATGDFVGLVMSLQRYPEMVELHPRLREAWAFYQANPPEPGKDPKPMRWADHSEQAQQFLIEYAVDPEGRYLDFLRDFVRTYPEVKKHPEVVEAIRQERERKRAEREESGELTWRDLGKELQPEAIADALEDLEGGLLDSVEHSICQFPPIRHADPRLMEIWEAMRKGKPRDEDQFGWEGLTEPSRRFVLEAALRDLEEGPDKARFLVRAYPELREQDARLEEL